MNTRRFHALFLAAACALSLVTSPRASAQEGVPDKPEGLQLGEMVNFALQFMKAQQWEKALAFNAHAVKEYGNGALKAYGPLFGSIYHRKGLCELQLKKWDEAAASFEQCYKNFPNKVGAMNENEFEKRALFYWAKAEMGREEWQKAIDLFQKFLNEREHPRDRFNQGDFFISRATCYYKLRQIVKGNTDFESALKNQLAFKVPDAAVLNCFRELVEAAMETDNEQALVDFIRKNRGGILTSDDDLYPHSGVLLKLATEALKDDMPRAALLLYQMIPATERAIDLTRHKLKGMGQLPGLRSPISGATWARKQLDTRLERLEKELDSPQSVEMSQLMAMAFMHETEGNVRGAYAAYRQLELFFPHSEKRETNLFNLARTSFMVDGGANGLEDAQLFLGAFPNSEHAPFIKRLMFSSLFAEGRYEECIESASQMIDKLQPGTPDHDQCLHVLGGSYFYTGQYELAAPLLEQHITQYPKSDSKVAAAYFHAANPYRMQEYTKAAGLLDAFLEKYDDPDENPFLPFALFDRATCHYMVEENDKAVSLCTRIIDNHKDASVVDQAYNLRGNAELALENVADAERDHKVALELAEEWGHEVVAGEALFFLADLMITEGEKNKDKERLMQALPFINTFWDKYGPESPFRRQMAVLQVPVLKEDGRLEEALKQLEVVIAELAKDEEALGLERVLPSYTEAYLEAHTTEQLRTHYRQFPGIALEDKAARALLYIEIIKVFEDVADKARKAENLNLQQSAEATVKNTFQELKSQFQVKDLTAAILIRVGNYLRKTSTPKEALAFYNEVLERKDEKYRFDALMGRADVYGQSQLPSDIDKGLADFQMIYAESEDEDQKEFSLFRIIELLMNKKEYAAAEEKARAFLENKETNKLKRGRVFLLLGESFEKRKMPNDAIAIYSRVFGAFMGNIGASAPAMERWMRLMWERNRPAKEGFLSDRQAAYEKGHEYVELTKRLKDKMISEDLEAWQKVEQLVTQYEANPNIKAKRPEPNNP